MASTLGTALGDRGEILSEADEAMVHMNWEEPKPSELFNDEDETEELICGQNTKHLRNNTWKGEKLQCSSETPTGKEKAKKVQASEGQSCCLH